MPTLDDVAGLLKNLTQQHAGEKEFQQFYEFLYHIALQGMNIGGGSLVDYSGERAVVQYIKNSFQATSRNKPRTIFDVGGNVGDYARMLHEVFGNDDVEVFSFEPSVNTFQKLLKNVGAIKNINLYNFGFSNEPGIHTLFMDKPESGLASLHKRRLDHFQIQTDCKETVVVRTIDDFCSEQRIERIDFLKIDVEGHEMQVLEGAKQMLKARAIGCIQFEFGGCNIDSRTFFQDFYYLLKDNYNIFRIVKDGIHPLPVYKESYEIFTTTNFFAQLKKTDI